MNPFWERITLDEESGAVYDGNRRYLVMRPDVLMGMVRALAPTVQEQVLTAFYLSAFEQGGKSVSAYQSEDGMDRLQEIVVQGAEALGWGKWVVSAHEQGLGLQVHNSPFAAGYGQSDVPVCAPVKGIFRSLAEKVLGASVTVEETSCAAQGHGNCCFVARTGKAAA